MINLVLSILFIINYLLNTYLYLNIYQQAHYKYKRINKYHKIFIKNNCFFIICIYFNILNNKLISTILIFILLFINLFILISRILKQIVYLKFTKRIIRISLVHLIISLLLFIGIYNCINYSLPSLYLINLFLPLLLFLSTVCLKPIEYSINNKYISSAKSIISNVPNLIVIMITGSYGKTTIKNIIYELIKKDYITVSTPKSYNTELGICKVINESITRSTEVFVVEAGAAEVNDLKKICEIVKPDICVISEIGNQHLETFKTIDNIIKEKFSIVNYLKDDGFVVLNNDNLYIKEKELIHLRTEQIKRVSINNVDNINYFPKLSFTVNGQLFKTNLLGKHNITNILLSLEVINVLKYKNIIVKPIDIINRIENIKPIKNRLEYRQVNNINIFDDCYNCNYQGFKNAIDLLKHSANKKIIITPGIVELGVYKKCYNEEIGLLIGQVFDEVYLVKSEVTKYLELGLIKANKEYYLCDKFIDAYNEIIKDQKTIIDLLIENDVPDIYKER